MSDEDDLEVTWHTGLFARLDSSFPKKCMNCGRIFKNADQYFTETEDVSEQNKGLKSYVDDDTATVVEAFRNCPCGSTLMEMFDDHRDELQAETKRKERQEEIAESIKVEDPLAENAQSTPATKPTVVIDPPRSIYKVMDEFEVEFTDEFADDVGQWADAWYDGLRASGGDAFPKKCRNCGRIFETPDDFFSETANVKAEDTGLRECIDDNAGIFIEAFRNCPCGSTLMDLFTNRRDLSPAGLQRREKFDELLNFLIQSGLDAKIARAELLKVIRGGKSRILAKIKPPS